MNKGLRILVFLIDFRIWTKIMDQSQPSHEINPSPGLFVSADWFSAFILSTRSAGCFTLGHLV